MHIAVGLDHLAEMDADAHLEPSIFSHGVPNISSAGHGARYGVEAGEHAVSKLFEKPTTILRKRLLMDLLVGVDNPESRLFVLTHQSCEANDVREQDRCQFPFLCPCAADPNRLIQVMPFSVQRVLILVLGQDVLVEFEVGAKQVVNKSIESGRVSDDRLAHKVRVDVDANRAHEPVVRSENRDCCAFELTRTDVQLVVDFVFAPLSSRLQIKDEIRCAAPNRTPGYRAVFDGDERP